MNKKSVLWHISVLLGVVTAGILFCACTDTSGESEAASLQTSTLSASPAQSPAQTSSPAQSPSLAQVSTPSPTPTRSDLLEEYWKHPRDTAALSLNFAPYYLPGADPEQQSPVSEQAMRDMLDAIVPFTDTIRTFGVSGELGKLYKIAKEEYGLRIIAGCWIGPGYSEQQIKEELDLLAGLGNLGLADIVIVGSEGLHRGDYGAEELIGWVDYLKGELTGNTPVGVSDTAGALLGHQEVMAAVDVILFTYYPYFSGVGVENALADFESMYRRLEQSAEGTKLICGETGWRFTGNSIGAAEPGSDAANRYLNEMIAFSKEEDLEICYFEAVEENWKMKYNDGGWGLLDENLKRKAAVADTLENIVKQCEGE